MKLILKWLLSAAALLAVAHLYSGVQVASFTSALVAALGPAARLEAQRRLALARLSHGPRDALPPSEGGGDGLQAVLDALAQGDEEQRAAHAALQAYASELLAMDFDGHLRAPIERIVRQAGPSGGD